MARVCPLYSPLRNLTPDKAGVAIDLPVVNFFTTFAAKAWYHGVLADHPDDLEAFLRKAEAFATDEYAPLLHKGSRASQAQRERVLAGMERFNGISADYWDKASLRMGEARFTKELLRDRGQNLGRIDSRFAGDFQRLLPG